MKSHLGLSFAHHDAGEDARASAEVVLQAEAHMQTAPCIQRAVRIAPPLPPTLREPSAASATKSAPDHGVPPTTDTVRQLGTSEVAQGNIDHNHIYLRSFFDKFPAEAIGGPNRDSAAACEIVVEWGGTSPVQTDLDGKKKFFRKRGWIRSFFEANAVVPGSIVLVEQLGHLSYRVRVIRS
ncbi:DNA binding protein [Mesorhizobium sp. A556]